MMSDDYAAPRPFEGWSVSAFKGRDGWGFSATPEGTGKVHTGRGFKDRGAALDGAARYIEAVRAASAELHIKDGTGPCETHDWTGDDFRRRLVALMRERHGRGGLNVCTDCLSRAKEAAR